MRCALSATVPLFLNMLQLCVSVRIHAPAFVVWFCLRAREHLQVARDLCVIQSSMCDSSLFASCATDLFATCCV